MKFSRRGFLRVGGSAALTALAACDQAPWTLLPGWRPALVDTGTFQAPQSPQIDLIVHVLNRASYGRRGNDYARVQALAASPEVAVERYIAEQLDPDALDDAPLQAAIRRYEVLSEPLGELYEYKERYLLDQMVGATLLRAVYSQRQLYELMVQFWTDHFNIDSSKGECKWLKAADDRDVIRLHALGKFPELLRASALSPAMLWYLDGRVNQKQQGDHRPNENYARELLELHTLGVHGGYTQNDVMEVARCLTGWSVRDRTGMRKGSVTFDSELHDDGVKHVLGREIPAGLGRDDLDHVLRIVAMHPATARHLAFKLCRRFIADDPPQAAQDAVAEAFMRSAGDIKATLRALFNVGVMASAPRGTKLRRPFEYIVAALRATNSDTNAGPPITEYLLRMGQAPFHYPTPEGYPIAAATWLGTLLWRWNFAVALTEQRIPGTYVDHAGLEKSYGSIPAMMAGFLGRQATAEESDAYVQSGHGLALILSSPAFQYC